MEIEQILYEFCPKSAEVTQCFVDI